MATVIVPYSLRARPRATVATPLTWTEIETTDPDAFGIDDLDRLLDRPDPLAELASAPSDTKRFLAAIDAAFEASGLVLETFDRFRS
jgi:bifunctional non-homologous end joining protein LigD